MSLSKCRLLFILQFIFSLNAFSQFNTSTYLQEAREDIAASHYFDAIQKLDVCIQTKPGQYDAYFFRGVCKYYLNDDLGAEADLNVAVNMYDPYLSDAYHYRSFVRYRLGDYEGAIRDVDQLISIQGKDPKLYMERAFSKLSSQDYNGAIKDCYKVLSMQYVNENLYLCLGMAQNALNKFDSALVYYNKALVLNPKNEEIYVRIGMVNANMSNYNDAIEEYNKALKIDSASTLAYFSRAEAYMKMNKDKEAMEDFNTVIIYDPLNSIAYYDRAIIESNKNNYNDALADFSKVIMLNPKNIQALFNRAKLRCALNDLQGALSDYDKTIELFPYFVEAYNERARLKESLHDYKGAQADYNTGKVMGDLSHFKDNSQRVNDSVNLSHLLALNSDFDNNSKKLSDTASIGLLPLFYLMLSDKNSAKTVCSPVFLKKTKQVYNDFCIVNKKTTAPDNITDSALFVLNKDSNESEGIILRRAVQETNLQLFNDAIKDYNNIIEQNTGSAIAYFQRGISQCKEMEMLSRFNEDKQYTMVNKTYKIVRIQNNDKYESALADFNKTIEIEPEFAFAYYNRAFVKYKLKDLKGAIDDYNKAIEIDPGFGDAYYNRGLLFFCLNDKISACQDYSKAGELGVTEAYLVIKLYCSQILK